MSTSPFLPRRTPGSRAGVPVTALAILLIAAGCGGSAATAAPTPVPTIAVAATTAPTEAPAAATEVPTPEPTAEPTMTPSEAVATPAVEASADPTRPASGTFLYGYDDLLAYYQSEGYTCQEPGPSAVAAGYTTHICTLEADGVPMSVIGFLVAEDGTLGDIFAGVLNAAGGAAPSAMDMISPLAFILGATLGETDGTEAATWLAENIGSEMAQTTINGNTIRTYTVDDDSGVGAYAEVSTPEYEAAPAP